MWFGTRDGLNRYDGYNFTYYVYDANNPRSLGIGRVSVLYSDQEGHLWIGTDQGGLNLYVPESDDFIRIDSIPDGSDERVRDIRDMLQADDGRLWIASQGNGLLYLYPDHTVLRRFQPVSEKNITALTYFGEDMYYGTPEGLYLLRGIRSDIRKDVSGEYVNELNGLQILDLFSDKDSALWIGTYGEGAFVYSPSSGHTVEFSTTADDKHKINHDIIRTLIDFPGNKIMIGTGGGGINLLDRSTGRMEMIRHSLNYPYSLNSDIIYSFYRDDEQNLWIGTYNGGVNILFDAKDKFGHLKSYGGSNDLSNNAVLSICEGDNGLIWIGTDGGGLDLYDPVNGTFRHFRNDPSNPNSLSGNVVKTIFLNSKGIVWLGTFTRGMCSFNPATGHFRQFLYKPGEDQGISNSHIWDIEEDSLGYMWFATLGGGLDRYDVRNNRFRNYRNDPQDPSSLSSNTLSSLLYDSRGNLWVGTEYGGVCRLIDPEKGIFKVYSNEKSADIISSNHVTTIFEDSRGNIWVGTIGGGLGLFLPEEDRFKSYTKSDGLIDNLVYSILEDDLDNLWIGTNNGLSKFEHAVERPSSPFFKSFSVGDGLQSNEFSPQSACRTHDGLLYFGGINGINFFDPSHIKTNQHIPPVVITDFRIFNKTVIPNAPGSPLNQPISRTKEIILTHKQSVISFQFAALDYTMPSRNKYRYILEPFEDKWNEVGNQRTATYTNLNPDTYTFRVNGSNNDDVWNYEGVSINLTILPPFWKTWYFRIGVLLTVLMILIVLYRLKISSLNRQRRKLKLLVDERTKKLLDLNQLLEEQNKKIMHQSEELMVQKEHLIHTNKELERNQVMIKEQNEELGKHRNHLEELVQQRTSELEAAKARAEESDRLKTSFLSNMSHEIRTPLNAIVGFSALLNEDDTTDEERLEFLQQINRNSDLLLVLIDDILDLSKIESNQLDVVSSVINLNEFIDELYTTFSVKASGFEFRKINSSEKKKIVFVSDIVRLRQILFNLLDNSFKFTENGYVELGVKLMNKNHLLFHVEDTGIGMSKDILDKIYDRFFKLDHDSRKIYRGTGLGLTITRKLVKLLGGNIEVRSEEGKGTRFEIILPVEH